VWRAPESKTVASLPLVGAHAVAALDAIEVPGANDPREMAIGMLNTAAEIEHGVMIEYLFAALSAEDPEAMALIAGIAVEEMGHLLTVQNMLLYFGSEPVLRRQDQSPHPDVDPFTYRLAPADRAVVATFVAAEAPEASTLGWYERRELAHIRREAKVSIGGKSPVHRVGALYARLQRDLGSGGPLHGHGPSPEALERQADGSEPWAHAGLGRQPVVDVVKSSEDAVGAIKAISAQGEGFPSGEESHFVRFRRLHRGMRFVQRLPEAWAFSGAPADGQPRALRPLVRALGGFSSRVAEISSAAPETPVSYLFNLRYQILLLLIHEVLELARQDPGRLPLIRLLLTEMALTLRPLGQRLREVTPSGQLPQVYLLPQDFPADDPRTRRRCLLTLIEESRRIGAEVTAEGGYVANVVLAMNRANDECLRLLGV
jgi:hypothetical protein